MTKQSVLDYISNLDANDLDALKSMLAKREEELYDERWWTHEHIDEYIYMVHYKDGSKHRWCIAKDAYKNYLLDDNAEWIERYTKDLFPTYEFLERKYDA